MRTIRITNQRGCPLRTSRVLVLCSRKHFEAVSFLGLSSPGYRPFFDVNGCRRKLLVVPAVFIVRKGGMIETDVVQRS